jgi:hypothetical protein
MAVTGKTGKGWSSSQSFVVCILLRVAMSLGRPGLPAPAKESKTASGLQALRYAFFNAEYLSKKPHSKSDVTALPH